jgi:uncharacterized repeat protein (TIGR01451 family)
MKNRVSLLAAALTILLAPNALASNPVGSAIVNTAAATYEMDGASGQATSNTATTTVIEVLDLTLSNASSADVEMAGRDVGTFGIPFILTNTGNGTEAFQVEAAAPDEQMAPTVAIDVDGNGAYDPAVDNSLSGQATPVLAPGAHLKLLLRFAKLPTSAGSATITARAVTGSGAAGTVFIGGGDGGTDAVVGQTQAMATLPISYRLGSNNAAAELLKSQTVRAPNGGDTPVPGAVITYRLALTVGGQAVLSDAEIVDPIPAGTAFVPGSIKIEDVAASDVADADTAFFDGQAIHIAMGEISQPTTRVVTFQVTIL